MFDAFYGKSRKIAAYKKLFLTCTGQLKPEAETVLNDLFDFTRFFKNVPADPQSLAVVEGGRQVVRHILKSTRTTEQELKRQLKMKEGENDD